MPKMPITQHIPINFPSYEFNKFTPYELELAKATFPIFGGTAPTPKDPESSLGGENQPPSDDGKKDETNSAGGEPNKPETLTPEQIASLMAQVTSVTNANKELEKKLEGFTKAEEEKRKASMGREEALTEDLNKAHATIAAMDEIIKHVALVNAIQSDKDFQFHDIDFVIAKLDENGYEFEIDMDSKKANVKGINNELRRIAKENEWAVKKVATDPSTRKPPARATGAPPAAQATNSGKANSREALIERFPAIGAGRSRVPMPQKR